MIPPTFDYVRPASLDDALAILSQHQGEAKVIAGGHSLIPLLKLRLAEPALLVDIRDIGGLDGITETDDWLTIGAKTTHATIAAIGSEGDRYPLLAEVAVGIGDRQVRNWGTIGGSIAHADPASDWPAVLIALRADIVCRRAPRHWTPGERAMRLGEAAHLDRHVEAGSTGERVVNARDFFVDTFQTALEPTEIVTEVRIPRRARRAGAAYDKLERKAGDFSTAGSAAVLQLADDGSIAGAGIGVTGVAETPFAATDAEAALVGQRPSEEVFRAAGAAAGAQSRPAGDVRGPVEYKRAMAAEMTVRALRRAWQRAQAYG